MNGTPSDCACIAAAVAASTGPPSTCGKRSFGVSGREPSTVSRRTRPIRSMSATKFTASVTVANSSGRIANIRKIGLVGVAPDDVAEQPQAVLVGPLDVVDEQRQRVGGASSRIATAPRSKARRSAIRRQVLEPGSSRPEMASTTRSSGLRCTGSGGCGVAPPANRSSRATRNGPRISSSAVTATHEAFGGRDLGRREEQPRLADARLAFEGDRGEAAGLAARAPA